MSDAGTRSALDDILLELVAAEDLTQRQLVERTGFSRSVVSESLKALVASGDVNPSAVRVKRPGAVKSEVAYQANKEGATFVGVTVVIRETRHCELIGVLCARDPRVVYKRTERRLQSVHPSRSELVAGVAEITQELKRGRRGAKLPVSAALSLGGHVDPTAGSVWSSPNMRWRHAETRLADELSERLHMPAHVINDVDAMALYESYFGTFRLPSFLYVLVADGVGAALVVSGELSVGSRGGVAELGHLKIAGATTECTCGGRGCLQSVVSNRVLRAKAKELKVPGGRILNLVRKADAGPGRARDVVQDAGSHLGHAVAAACNITDPGAVVIALGALENSEEFKKSLTARIDEDVLPSMSPGPIRYDHAEYLRAATGAALHAFMQNPRPSSAGR